jgi:hypothetical protein
MQISEGDSDRPVSIEISLDNNDSNLLGTPGNTYSVLLTVYDHRGMQPDGQ